MEQSITQLLDWASSHDIELNGIEPKVITGRGIGIVSTREIKPGETILSIPNNVLRRLDNTPKSITQSLTGATVHAILAASLAIDLVHSPSQDFSIWKDVFPTKQDIWTSMPFCWPVELQSLLPRSGQDLLEKQRVKFERDWSLVSTAYPETDRWNYLYAWLLVNTRTFYHTTPKTKNELPRGDHMVLQPVADLFNHSPQGCSVGFTHKGFTITATTAAAEGEEMFIRYGCHSNDLLLVEYGFILPSDMNSFDEVSLDEYILPQLSAEEKDRLDGRGYLGKYMLDAKTVCYRTQVALRCILLGEEQWLDFLGGERAEEVDQDKVNEVLYRILRRFQEDVGERKKEVNDASTGDVMRNMLRERWQQIDELVGGELDRMGKGP